MCGRKPTRRQACGKFHSVSSLKERRPPSVPPLVKQPPVTWRSRRKATQIFARNRKKSKWTFRVELKHLALYSNTIRNRQHRLKEQLAHCDQNMLKCVRAPLGERTATDSTTARGAAGQNPVERRVLAGKGGGDATLLSERDWEAWRYLLTSAKSSFIVGLVCETEGGGGWELGASWAEALFSDETTSEDMKISATWQWPLLGHFTRDRRLVARKVCDMSHNMCQEAACSTDCQAGPMRER